MPIGVTLLLFVATVPLTYCVAPGINQQFEKQKIVSSYITSNLTNFNIVSRELISEISQFNYSLKEYNRIDPESKNKIRTKITELQWRALELDVVFDDERSISLIKDYKGSLDNLREFVEKAERDADIRPINMAVIKYTDSTMNVVKALAEKGGLKMDTLK